MFNNAPSSISERIKDIRITRKARQDELADFMEIKRSTYQNREKNGTFTWSEIKQIADFFDESPVFIKYGVYDEELFEIINKYETKRFSVLNDVRFTVFDDIAAMMEGTESFASFLSLPEDEKEDIYEYVNSKRK